MRNLLAIFQFLIIPGMIYLIAKDSEAYLFAAIVLLFVSVIVSLLEWIYFKKNRDPESFLRPFSDKVLVLTVLTVLTIKGTFSWILLLFLIIRDLIVGKIRLSAARENILIREHWYGKIITSGEIGIIFSLLALEFLNYGKNYLFTSLILLIQVILISLVTLISLLSIIHYLSRYGKKIYTERRLGKLISPENMIILANPKSGGFRDSYRRYLLKKFAKRRRARIVILPATKDMFAGIETIIRKYPQIIIAGGDGSFESALNCPTFKNKSLGFFPLGAGNSYYSYFYKGKRFEYLRSRFAFREILLDILELRFNRQKIQTTFLSLGIDAEVINQMKSVKDHRFRDYCIAGAKVAFGPKQTYPIKARVDQREYYWNNCFNLIISKIPFMGFGLRSIIGQTAPEDGFILGLAQVNTHSSFFNKGLRLWTILLTQLGLNLAPLVPLKGKRFKITSTNKFSLQAGGEFLGHTTAFIVEVKRKQKVLVIS